MPLSTIRVKANVPRGWTSVAADSLKASVLCKLAQLVIGALVGVNDLTTVTLQSFRQLRFPVRMAYFVAESREAGMDVHLVHFVLFVISPIGVVGV